MRPAIVLPWAFLAQANHRLMPVVRGGRARLITAPQYRQAKESAELSIRRQWKGSKLSGPLALVARCYFPDRIRRDSSNYAKLIEDAMSGICYEDDSQIEDSRWIKAGYDKDNPRVEIEVTMLDAPPKAERRPKSSPIEPISILGSSRKTPKRRTDNSVSEGGQK